MIKHLLRKGGMGAVYFAEHIKDGTPCAVKVLLPELTSHRVVAQRFVREVEQAMELQHRHIVEIYGVRRHRKGSLCILLDHVPGSTLAGLIRADRAPIALHRIVHLAGEIASGLQATHDHQLVHRDLRPGNVRLGARDDDPGGRRARISDHGMAHLGADRAGLLTRAGTVIGSPAFKAPEQLRGEPATPAADIYALGVIAYYLTTGGRLPYQDDGAPRPDGLTAAELYHRQMTWRPIDPRRHAPAAGEAWVRAIGAALEADPARRPPTAGAFVRLLAEAAPGDGRGPSGLDVLGACAPELLADRAVRPGPWPAEGSRYQLGATLGTGGTAEVLEATVAGAEGFVRRVAIKRVRVGPSESARVLEEARIASRLSHPNIVPVLDLERDAEGRLLLVMELVEGKDLAALAEAGRPPPSLAIFVVSEILRGLGYAHELPRAEGVRGYVHRDVSPHNVLVSWEGAVKVSDFGLAKALEGSEGARSSSVRGKPSYMSPEQVNAEALDGRSDLFAVGIILWELLTGEKLFTGGTREAFAKILFGDVPRPGALAQGVPADLEAVAMKLLARDREGRYPTAEAAIEALARCADNPRNGRSELVRWMAQRFPAGARPGAAAPWTGGRATVTAARELAVGEPW